LLERAGLKAEDIDAEFYLKGNKLGFLTCFAAQALLRLTGINMSKTILVHVIKTGDKYENEED